MMPRPSDPNSQRAVAEFFGLKPDRFCRLLQRHGVDYQNRVGVAEMLRRSTSMSPTTRKAVDAVLKVETPDTTTKPPVTHLETLETMASNSPPRASTVEDAEAFLETLKKSLAIAEETSAELRSLGQYEDSRRWLALHSQLAKQFAPLARQIMDLKERMKITVTTKDAQATFNAFLMLLRGELERLPSSLASRVNIHDPEHAHTMIDPAIVSIFKKLNNAPSVMV